MLINKPETNIDIYILNVLVPDIIIGSISLSLIRVPRVKIVVIKTLIGNEIWSPHFKSSQTL